MELILDLQYYKIGGIMGKKSNPLNILYIEDEQKDCERLQMDANIYRIQLTHKTNLEEGIETFKKKGEKFFDGIILDALCLIKRDDSIPKKGHVLKAWKEFHTLAPHLPKAVFTGETAFAKDLNELLEETDVKIFNKGNRDDVERMLKMFVDDSKNNVNRKIASRYADVFEIFDKGYLDLSDREALLECIKTIDSNDDTKIKNALAGIRRLLESIYIAINKIDKDMVPDDLVSNGNVRFRLIQNHLRGQYNKDTKKHEGLEFIPFGTNIDQFAEVIYTVVTNYGSHKKYNDVSKYTLSVIIFSMMDMLLWFKRFSQDSERKQ